jgi:hypothetical protein
MTPDNKQLVYQETFLEEMFKRLHRHKVSQQDYTGLADMLNPIEALADSASLGLDFNDEPADFLRILNEVKYRGSDR